MKKLEVFFRKVLLRILLLVNPPAKKSSSSEYNSQSRVLFIRLNRIGDALVSTPLLRNIKEKLGCKIFVLADRKNKAAFYNNPDIDELFIFKKGLRGIFEVIRLIKDRNIDTVVDLHDDVSTTVSFIVALCGARNKLALGKWNNKIYTRTIPKPNPAEVHIVDRILSLSKILGIDYAVNDANIVYRPEEVSKVKAEEFLNKKFTDKKYLLGINISAGSEARYWGNENFNRLINFLKNYKINYIVMSSPDDFEKTKNISEENCFSSTKYDEFAGMISRLDMLFTPDTAAVHLASAFNVPVFGIYVKYNTTDMIWSPYASEFEYVVTGEPNLNNVKFEEVINKFKPFLEKHL